VNRNQLLEGVEVHLAILGIIEEVVHFGELAANGEQVGVVAAVRAECKIDVSGRQVRFALRQGVVQPVILAPGIVVTVPVADGAAECRDPGEMVRVHYRLADPGRATIAPAGRPLSTDNANDVGLS